MKTEPIDGSQSDCIYSGGGAKNPFNLRVVILNDLATAQTAAGKSSRTTAIALQKSNQVCVTQPKRSLEVIRQILQSAVNAELKQVIDKYISSFIHPAVENMRRNNEDVTENDIRLLSTRILDEAKKMFIVEDLRPPAVVIRDWDQEKRDEGSSCSTQESKPSKVLQGLRKCYNREGPIDSDAESDTSQISMASCRVRKKPKQMTGEQEARPESRSSTPGGKTTELTLADIPKWNPERLNGNSLFILGSTANRALGMGEQRGKIYIKHPGLFRYVGDHLDKQWLFEQGNRRTRSGVRAFFLLLDDVLALADSPEYQLNPEMRRDELVGFRVPPFMLQKVNARMTSVFQQHKHRLQDLA